MDYYLLTELTARVAYHLALSGAETFRIEETMRRIIGAYGIECQAFAIPNCVMVSLEAANGKPLMVMKRVGFHGNDLESVEKLNALSRRICAETPPPGERLFEPLRRHLGRRSGSKRRSPGGAATRRPFITSAISLLRQAFVLSSAARCATASSPG